MWVECGDARASHRFIQSCDTHTRSEIDLSDDVMDGLPSLPSKYFTLALTHSLTLTHSLSLTFIRSFRIQNSESKIQESNQNSESKSMSTKYHAHFYEIDKLILHTVLRDFNIP